MNGGAFYNPLGLTVGAGEGSTLFDADGFLSGTLASFIPGHSEYGLSAVPANGGVIKNAAWRTAAKLLGLDPEDEASLHSTFHLGSDTGPTKFKAELTPKGGLHMIVSQSAGSKDTSAWVSVSDAIKQYVLDHTLAGTSGYNRSTNHLFALLIWHRVTRAAVAGDYGPNATIAGLLYSDPNRYNQHMAMSQDGDHSSWPLISGNFAYPSLATVNAPLLAGVTGLGWGNGFGKPATIADMELALSGAGCLPGQNMNFSPWANKGMSHVIYRCDLVDLTVCGLDYLVTGTSAASNTVINFPNNAPRVDFGTFRQTARLAFDFATSPGGYLYGDTVPTDPATIA